MLLECRNICKSYAAVLGDDEARGKTAADDAADASGAANANDGAVSSTGAPAVDIPPTVEVLHDVSFTLDRGQSLAVVAPSGAGKSTLLSIVGLLLEPTSGQVLIDGVDAATLSDDERSRMRAETIGMLYQHTQLIGSLRAVENVALPADFVVTPELQMSDEEVEQRATGMLQSFGLENRMYHFPFQMSIGQKRRVATARALFLNPALIIADEPTNDLDEENSQKVVDALFAPVASGKSALIYATHDLELAQRADNILKIGVHG